MSLWGRVHEKVEQVRPYLGPVGRLTALHWSWVNVKVWIAVWAILFFCYTPRVVGDYLAFWIVASISAITLVGVLTSLLGLVMSAPGGKNPIEWLTVEIVGLTVALVGGVGNYMVIQFLLGVGTPGTDRVALVAFAAASCSMIFARICLVVHRRRKETNPNSRNGSPW